MSGGANPQTTEQQLLQQSNSSQNATSTTGPNPLIAPILQGAIGGLVNWNNANPTAPGYYPNLTVAPASLATQQAQGALFARGATGSPLQAAGNNFAASVLGPNYLNVGNDPNFQASLAAGFQPQNQQFAYVMVPSLRAQFESSDRNLGGQDGATVDQALLGLQQSQANSSARAVEQAYNQRMQNQFAALNYIPISQNMDYQNIGAMAQAGANTDAANQAAINDAVARYNFNSMAQPNYDSDFISRILAAYPGGQTTGSGTSSGSSSGTSYGTTMPASNPTASTIGAITGGLGTAAKFLPFFFPSDARLKKNIRPVGKTNSGHNLYSYEFLGSDKPEIGVLAQEVERKDPEAVVTHPSGVKMVNYDRVLAPGGLM